MLQMKELYEKVAASEELRTQFTAIMQEAKESGEEETSKKLIQFAKDQGFSITIEEFKEFFQKLEDQSKGELSDAELDMVAGGKNIEAIFYSVVSLGLLCAATSAIGALMGDCGRYFTDPNAKWS